MTASSATPMSPAVEVPETDAYLMEDSPVDRKPNPTQVLVHVGCELAS